MSLPPQVIEYLNENARTQGVAPPTPNDDLFKTGVLDSFTLVDFVTLLEEQCGVRVPDGDVQADNFKTIAAIENYVASHRSGA